MNRKLVTVVLPAVILVAVVLAARSVDWTTLYMRMHGYVPASAQSHRLPREVTIPFESAGNNIYLRVMVGDSGPFWFIFDTGDKYGIIDSAKAQSLGVDLEGQISAGGGESSVTGNFVKHSSFRVVGLDGFTQQLFIAIPLDAVAHASGHEVAGILGYDFISQFVVDIDCSRQTLTLHDKTNYQYSGHGESLPITFNQEDHPQIRAQIIAEGRAPVEGTFVIDVGQGSALILHKPFVDRERLLQFQHIAVPGAGGIGVGDSAGKVKQGFVGRIKGLKLGQFVIDKPVTTLSQDASGPYASADAQGNIGGEILRRFNVTLDYSRNRIILEPNSHFAEPFEGDMSGVLLMSEGSAHKQYQAVAISDNSPASEAGLRAEDILVGIDGRPAAEYTLSQIRRMFKEEKQYDLTIARSGARLPVKLNLRRLI